MLPKYTLPVLAGIGFLFGTYSVIHGNKTPSIAPAVAEPSTAPFQDFIAGAGIIESQSQNIAIGTPLAGIVKKIAVKVGDKVKAQDLLFQLDDRETLAEIAIKRADLTKAQAGVLEALASLKDVSQLLKLAEAVTDKRAISTEELDRRNNAVAIAKARLESSKALVLQAEANLAYAQTTLSRLSVKAPVQGEILQVNIRPGEFAQAGPLASPLMIMGNMDQLHIRVDIDENDAWRFNPSGHAVAYLRGNRNFKTDLELAWVEPFVIPKKSLTGDSTERVDTRTLQALYRFERASMPAYIGQQVDVFIEVPK